MCIRDSYRDWTEVYVRGLADICQGLAAEFDVVCEMTAGLPHLWKGELPCPVSDWIYGFFMAWGMFLTIPCPKKIWRESARRKMLACLPLIGLIVGGIWALCAWLGSFLPQPLAALLCAAAPWLITGFMHLDGYMDVCDAVLSRRDLATRQRILKDSHCGAFAVICMVLLAMGQWSLFLAAEDVSWLALLLIPAATRACAGLAVLGLRPMGTSQYAAMGPARGGYGAALWVLLALSVGLPLWLDGSFGPLAAAVGYGLAVWYGFRNLDGMSGDISGFALTIGELCGCGAAILWR